MIGSAGKGVGTSLLSGTPITPFAIDAAEKTMATPSMTEATRLLSTNPRAIMNPTVATAMIDRPRARLPVNALINQKTLAASGSLDANSAVTLSGALTGQPGQTLSHKVRDVPSPRSTLQLNEDVDDVGHIRHHVLPSQLNPRMQDDQCQLLDRTLRRVGMNGGERPWMPRVDRA